MELSGQEEEMLVPINTTSGGGQSYGHGHMIHHDLPPSNHISLSSERPQIPSNGLVHNTLEEHVPYKKVARYRECLRNHAAAMGGNATDGCGEFMPSGEEGTLEALTCSVCNCHRNFHRKEVEGEPFSCNCYQCPHPNRIERKLILGHHKSDFGPWTSGYPTGHTISSRAAEPQQMIMSYNMGTSVPSESDEQEGAGLTGRFVARPAQLVKKRVRTKFTPEQKEKMLNFAEKIGWRLQRQEEALVQQFCQEVGVKRRVLKVWMHNNKHSLAKKNPSTNQDHI